MQQIPCLPQCLRVDHPASLSKITSRKAGKFQMTPGDSTIIVCTAMMKQRFSTVIMSWQHILRLPKHVLMPLKGHARRDSESYFERERFHGIKWASPFFWMPSLQTIRRSLLPLLATQWMPSFHQRSAEEDHLPLWDG